jgi:DNA repair exonuclease SbcCD ATPase subunit
VTQGDTPQSFDPLPQPDPGPHDGVWGIAFAVPAELAEPGTRLWLHDGGVYLADLLVPPPVGADPAARKADPDPTPAHEDELEDDVAADDPRARKLVEAWSDAATLREKLADREDELAEALKELLAARKDVQPLRERAAELEEELADARAELELVHKHGREARLRATEKAAELDTVRAELAAMQPGALEKRIAELQQQVERLEKQLLDAEVERTRLAALAEVEMGRLTEELETARQRKSRRTGFGRRSDDRAVQKLRAKLEAQVAERDQRIEELEREAESFAARRESAISESMQERLAELEEEVRQHVTCNQDLRSLLDSERELVAASRRDVHELRQQLATATANAQAGGAVRPVPATTDELAERRAPIEPPPWSALDDELLARIEKAKALTG